MNYRSTLVPVALVLALAGMGCSNTAEGAKEDVNNAGQAVTAGAEHAAVATKRAADNAGQAVTAGAEHAAEATKRTAKNTAAALRVTPRVKAAIIADRQLNDTRNLINVDSANNIVHLKGHVISEQMKQRAGEIAQKTLTEGHSTDQLSNELSVKP